MTVFAADLITEIQQRLGDSNQQIWLDGELSQYLDDAYNLMTYQTGCLFDTFSAPDYAFAFNFTADFEFEFCESISGFYCDGPANFTYEFERVYLNNTQGPANHTEHWEFNRGYSTAAGSITEVSATVDLPDDLHDIERSTWNTRRIDPLTARDIETLESRYELNKGIVEGYFREKDGLNTLRKWRVPNSGYIVFEFDSL